MRRLGAEPDGLRWLDGSPGLHPDSHLLARVRPLSRQGAATHYTLLSGWISDPGTVPHGTTGSHDSMSV